MSNSLVIGLYPTAPMDGLSFEPYLHKLSITAYAVDFDDPTTITALPHPLIGTAIHTKTSSNRIFQLKVKINNVSRRAAAGAAVIELPPAIEAKFLSPQSLINVILDVKRDGAQLVSNSVNYDVQVEPTANLKLPLKSLAGITVGLYLQLPNPAFDGSINALALPADGGPPPWAQLDAAVKAILAEDPATSVDIANLSANECMHIARELVSNHSGRPLPQPLAEGSPELEALYTVGATNSSDPESEIMQFESALTAYYSQLTGEAARMAGFVYAWSAAHKCRDLSKSAPNAALDLPVRLATSAGAGQQAMATVILGN